MMMHPGVKLEMARERAADLRRSAERGRLRRTARKARNTGSGALAVEPVTIREATDADLIAVAALAALDEKPVPAGRPLVAIRGGRLEAALDRDTGEVMADPFLPSEPSTRLVRDYAESLSADAA